MQSYPRSPPQIYHCSEFIIYMIFYKGLQFKDKRQQQLTFWVFLFGTFRFFLFSVARITFIFIL